jgi:hypothetical protein
MPLLEQVRQPALGLPDYLCIQYNRFFIRQDEIGLYFNDRWRILADAQPGSALDKWTPYNEKYNRMTTAS